MNQRRTFCFTVVTCLLALIFSAGPVLAAEGGNPAETPMAEFFKWLNFLIVLAVLIYFVAKNGPAFFKSRAATISAAMTEASAAKAEAERVLSEAQGKLAHLDQETAALRAASERDAASEAERLQLATTEEIGKIGRAARTEIEAAERAARMELRVIGARLAVERAEALLKQQTAGDTQAALFGSFVESLTGSSN
jgi:F-type H+-transporting ATPase subunit b